MFLLVDRFDLTGETFERTVHNLHSVAENKGDHHLDSLFGVFGLGLVVALVGAVAGSASPAAEGLDSGARATPAQLAVALFGDHVVVMDAGTVVQAGPPAKLLAEPGALRTLIGRR